MKTRLAGLVLWTAFIVMMLPGLVLLPLWIVWRGGHDRNRRLLRSMDNFCNVLWCRGSPYETISSHAFRHRQGHMASWYALLDFFVPFHAEDAAHREREIIRAAHVEGERE